ncbi:MAG: 3'-5' exonuclease domain-containing protein 2 [Muribaculum sp.]|nr:3'-5' exonuclease domain-containing protein 2 [Muribaculaceae bacterium]MCM1080374.1 3'-5' exonuclease domain-containing protein 2 [Muribaculum sp.]
MKLSITKEQIAELPDVTYSGNIHVVTTEQDAQKALNAIYRSNIVGFDTETKPSFTKGHRNSVALIQIATPTDCYLFRINRFGFCKSLVDFMQNNQITKIGLSLRDDFHVLHNIASFEPQGFIDLQQFVSNFSIANASLQKIFAIIFNQRISKRQQLSNWEADTLTTPQMNYAAIDAWACLKIYKYLTSGSFNPQLSPYRSELQENEQQNNISPQS